ncbi:hypothetical protein D3C87_2069750 [compost metagenome]
MANADGTRVRLNFKVYSPYGMSTPESLIQLKLMRAKSQAVETPAAETTTPAETEK